MFVTLALIGAAHLVVTWVLYPVAVIAAGRVARLMSGAKGELPDTRLPTVTVVIATRDEATLVEARVRDVLASSYPASLLDVVVAIDARAESLGVGSLKLAGSRVRVVQGDEPGGKCPALNAGARAAKGEILAFTDTHQRFEAQTIRRLVGSLLVGGFGATSGRLLLPRDAESSLVRLYTQYELAIREGEAYLHSAVGVSGSVWAMRRALWRPLPDGLILDDLYTPMRLVLSGQRVGFQGNAIAYEQRRVAPGQEYRRKVRTLTGNLQLCAWLPSVLLPIRNPIWIQFTCHKLLRLATPYGAALLALGLVGEAVSLAGDRLPLALCAASLVGVWIALGRDSAARHLRSLTVQAVSLQAAVVVATANAFRGRWDVWQR